MERSIADLTPDINTVAADVIARRGLLHERYAASPESWSAAEVVVYENGRRSIAVLVPADVDVQHLAVAGLEWAVAGDLVAVLATSPVSTVEVVAQAQDGHELRLGVPVEALEES